MHKNAKRTRNNSKFKHDTHVLVACSLYVNVLAIQAPSFPSVTPFCLSKHNEKNQVYHKQFTSKNRVGCDIKYLGAPHRCASVLYKWFLTPFRDDIWNRRQLSVGDRGVLPTRPKNRRGYALLAHTLGKIRSCATDERPNTVIHTIVLKIQLYKQNHFRS